MQFCNVWFKSCSIRIDSAISMTTHLQFIKPTSLTAVWFWCAKAADRNSLVVYVLSWEVLSALRDHWDTLRPVIVFLIRDQRQTTVSTVPITPAMMGVWNVTDWTSVNVTWRIIQSVEFSPLSAIHAASRFLLPPHCEPVYCGRVNSTHLELPSIHLFLLLTTLHSYINIHQVKISSV